MLHVVDVNIAGRRRTSFKGWERENGLLVTVICLHIGLNTIVFSWTLHQCVAIEMLLMRTSAAIETFLMPRSNVTVVLKNKRPYPSSGAKLSLTSRILRSLLAPATLYLWLVFDNTKPDGSLFWACKSLRQWGWCGTLSRSTNLIIKHANIWYWKPHCALLYG